MTRNWAAGFPGHFRPVTGERFTVRGNGCGETEFGEAAQNTGAAGGSGHEHGGDGPEALGTGTRHSGSAAEAREGAEGCRAPSPVRSVCMVRER